MPKISHTPRLPPPPKSSFPPSPQSPIDAQNTVHNQTHHLACCSLSSFPCKNVVAFLTGLNTTISSITFFWYSSLSLRLSLCLLQLLSSSFLFFPRTLIISLKDLTLMVGGEETIMLMIRQGVRTKQAPLESRVLSWKMQLQKMLTESPNPVRYAQFFSKNPILKSSQGHFRMKQKIPLKNPSLRTRLSLPRYGMWMRTIMATKQKAKQQARKMKLLILLDAPLMIPTFSTSSSSPQANGTSMSLETFLFHLTMTVAASKTSVKQKKVYPQVRMVTMPIEQQQKILMREEQEERQSKMSGRRMQMSMTWTRVRQTESRSFLDSGWSSPVLGWEQKRMDLSQSRERESLTPSRRQVRFCIIRIKIYYSCLITLAYISEGTIIDECSYSKGGGGRGK